MSMLHVAVWTPITIGLLGVTGRMLRKTAKPEPAKKKRTRKGPPTAAQLQRERERGRKQAAQEAAQLQRDQARAARELAAEQRAQAKEQRSQEAAERRAARELAAEQRAQAKEQRSQEAAERRAARELAAEERKRNAADRAAARAQAAPKKRSPKTQAFGADPNKRYEFRYKVIDLDQLITSNTETGAINPEYDSTLQPRQRERAASQRQIEQVARSLVPESLLLEFHQLDKGAPIVGSDRMVESGNGRVLALKRARAEFPDQYENYKKKLRGQLAEVGIEESALEGKSAPVLVRERITDVDRVAFTREANAAPVLQMSTLENALIDRTRITDESILRFNVREGQTLDQALRTKHNAPFVASFVGSLNENEAAALMRANGTLNQFGIWRLKAALFAKVFEGESGQRIADTFLESLDSTTKNFETSIASALPVLARAESLIASGQRPAELRLSDDISKALDTLARLRESETPVDIYLDQATIFDRELTDDQEKLLRHFDQIGRSTKSIKAFLNGYAAAVEGAAHQDQAALFELPPPSKSAIIDRLIADTQPAAKAA